MSKEEVKQMFKRAVYGDADELDFNLELIKKGYTPENIHQYANERQAEYFTNYCLEHGLA